MLYLKGVIEALKGNTKPVVFSILGDQSPLLPEFVALAREHRIILSRSADRSLRAMAQVTFYGRAIERARSVVAAKPFDNLPKLGKGTLPEWRGKQLLAAAGISIPQGALAGTVDEAVKTAAGIGYPVAMKAQAAALAHKTEAGAVILNVADEAGVRRAWQTLVDNVQRAQPGSRSTACWSSGWRRRAWSSSSAPNAIRNGGRSCWWASAASGWRRSAMSACSPGSR